MYFLICSITFALPFNASCYTDDEIDEKQIEVAMRLIGHEVLKSLDDHESRILPIQKIDEQYKISFDVEIGFEPGDIVSIFDSVMAETGVATVYLVEIEQCDSNAIVHSFVGGNEVSTDLVPCGGRTLPKDCYNLLVTILDEVPFENVHDALSNALPLSHQNNGGNPLQSTLFIVSFVVLLGFIGYVVNRKFPETPNMDLIQIGQSQFNEKLSQLSFGDKIIELSNKEAELLILLNSTPNQTIEREVLLQKVWGDSGGYIGRTLDVFISKLRKKLEVDSTLQIANIRGVGYKLIVNLPG